MRRFRPWFPLVGVLLAVSAFTAGYEILVPHHHAPPGIALTNLSSVQQLQTRFNQDRGEPRLILIFSPTSASWVQNHILKTHPHARLAVYALWTDKLSGDSWSQWDTDGLVAHLPNYQGGEWDAYLLFGPNAAWTATPHSLLSSGSTVIGSSAQLQAGILPLLAQGRPAAGG